MKERKSKRAHKAADNGCNYRAADISKDTGQLIEFKWCPIESLDEPCSNDRATGIGHGKNRSARKITIAEQIGRESGSDHADDDRPPYGRTECYQESGSNARCRPEHRDAVGLVEQSEAKACCEEKNDRDRDGDGPRRPRQSRVRWGRITCGHLQAHRAYPLSIRNSA